MSTHDSMDGAHVIPDEIRDLLERRSTFQEWLDRLGNLGSEFRPEVAAKVRSDYEGRLARVEADLEGHRTDLEAALTERRAAVSDVSERHDARAAELEETELRHRVGEFDDEQWEHRRAEHQVALDELAADLSVHSSAVAALEAVLDELAGRAAPAREPGAAPEAEASFGPDVAVAAEMAAPGAAAPTEAREEAPVVEESPVEESAVAATWMTQPFAERDSRADEDVAPEVVAEEGAAGEDVVEETVPEEPGVAEAVADETDGVDSVPETVEESEEPAEFMDELEFLESLSLDDADSFDAVSAMLDEEEDETESDRRAEDL